MLLKVRPRPAAWFFFLTAFALTLGLGTWQVFRLQWKENLIATIEEAQKAPAVTKLPTDEAELKKLDFHPVKLSGVWLHEIEYHLYPRFYKNARGYAIFTPLQLNDGRVIIINRGWVPEKKKAIEDRRETIAAGRANVVGMLRLGRERHFMTPKNDPLDNIWFGRDTDEMAMTYDVQNVIPATVDAVGVQDDNRLPVPATGEIKLRNDHLSYLITWYLLAFAVLVMFIIYHRKPR